MMTDMTTEPKGRSPAHDKRTAGTAHAAPSRPFIRFYHPEALRKKTLAVLDALEQAGDPAGHRGALADIAAELTNSGLDYCFLRPLKQAGVGFIVQQSANLGIVGVQQVMGSVIRNIVGRMDGPQLLSVCASIRELMH